MTHDLVVRRVSTYFQQASTDPAHIHYLCFVASIAGSYNHQAKDERIFYEVALDLLIHKDSFLSQNKEMLSRKGSKFQMYKRLECIKTKVDYEVLSE